MYWENTLDHTVYALDLMVGLCFCHMTSKQNFLPFTKARLHSPVDNISTLLRGIDATDVQMKDDVIFILQTCGIIKIIENEKGALHQVIVSSRQKRKILKY